MSYRFPTTDETIEFVINAHKYQKYGSNSPYIVHLMLVARHFDDWLGRATALLHDVLEDTEVVPKTILDMYGSAVAAAVMSLTRFPNEHYLRQYIPRVSQNILATRVKMADLQENIYAAENWYPAYAHLIPKYRKALTYLIGHSSE